MHSARSLPPSFAILVLALSVVACDSNNPSLPSSMTPNQPENTLRIEGDGDPVNYPIKEATYNWMARDHGVEFTLQCKTADVPDQDNPPKLEVTIVLDEKPELKAGSKWLNQPGYIDRDPLYNMTNYYQYSHESFEDFSVVILNTKEDIISCHIKGIAGEYGGDPVSIFADFKRDESLKRGVW